MQGAQTQLKLHIEYRHDIVTTTHHDTIQTLHFQIQYTQIELQFNFTIPQAGADYFQMMWPPSLLFPL